MTQSKDINQYSTRTLTRDLTIGLIIAVILTVAIHIVIYFLYSSVVSERELRAKADSVAEELTDIMTISLWNLSHNVIHQISNAYIKSGYIAGIRVQDDHGNIMYEHIPDKIDVGVIEREKEIYWKGTNVGQVKLWFTGQDTKRIQKDMINAMMLIGLSVMAIITLGIHFIMKYLMRKPLDQLIQGIRTIASGDYQSPLPIVPQKDINAIITEANMMADQISSRNQQLKKEILERTRAEDELKKLNKTLELRIKQLVATERALAESEKKYRGIFENALEGIFQTTPDGRFIDANPSMAHILGYDTPDEMIQSVTNIELQHYVDPNQRNEYLDLLKEKDFISNYECQFYRKDGSIIWGVLQVRAFRDAYGRLTRLEGLLQDITERKTAEAELRESAEKYRQLYEGSRDGYVMTDIDGRFIECNSSYCEMLDYTLDELKQLKYSMITPEKWHNWEIELLREQTISRGYTDVYEKEYIRKDGHIFPVEMRAYIIHDNDGTPTGFWAYVRDITERKKLQAEAMRNARLASLGELAAGVAHEINNPINGIINYAQILINRSNKDGTRPEIPERIIKEGVRIERIVRGLLSFARERKKKKYSIHIKKILTESMDFIQSMLRKDNIQIQLELPDKMPEIKANAQQIQQVFLNIISNARYALNQKYSGPGNKKNLKIKTEMVMGEDQGQKIRIEFFDNGTGIASDILDRICDPFFSTKPGDKGTGLGLSISHGIINDHNGKLWAESKEGHHTNMIVELPI